MANDMRLDTCRECGFEDDYESFHVSANGDALCASCLENGAHLLPEHSD